MPALEKSKFSAARMKEIVKATSVAQNGVYKKHTQKGPKNERKGQLPI